MHLHGTVDLVICVVECCAVDGSQRAQEGLLAMELLTLQCSRIKEIFNNGQRVANQGQVYMYLPTLAQSVVYTYIHI